jgi:IS30 family transposase
MVTVTQVTDKQRAFLISHFALWALPACIAARFSAMRNAVQRDVATNVQVYFCDPLSPWQRGSNENTNGLLRQYFPRGTDLSRLSQDYLNRIARRLNQCPRKTLGFETPAD